jgi:hypothetical protein
MIFAQRAMIGLTRVAFASFAIYATTSAIVLMSQGRWLTHFGPSGVRADERQRPEVGREVKAQLQEAIRQRDLYATIAQWMAGEYHESGYDKREGTHERADP